MTMTQLSMYEQIAEATKAETPWLGQIVTYTVSETTLDYDVLAARLRLEGLEAYLPKRPHDADVFRRICTAAERKKVPTGDPEVFANILIRDVGRRGGIVTRRVVCELVNALGRRLSYHEAWDLSFESDTGTLTTTRLATGFPAADEVADEVRTRYPRLRGTVDGGAIRTLVRRVLVGHDGVSVRESGGLYFLPQYQADVVDRLFRFVDTIPGSRLIRIPLIDNSEQRATIREAAVDHTLADIDGLVTEIAKLLEQDTVRPVSATTAMQRFQAIQDRADKYTALLETNLGGVAARLEVLDMQVAELVKKATSKASA